MSAGQRWDVFLSHSHADRAAVAEIGQRLRDEFGLRPFLDRWHLTPGRPWQVELAEALSESAAAAVFIGPEGVTPWHHEELQMALDRAVAGDDEFRVIPVLLPGVDGAGLPRLLVQRTWVDFRPGLDDDDALRRLSAAVRGEAVDDGGYELPDVPTPYRGLLRFNADDADFFFGRTREADDLVRRVGARRFVAVEGASGSGKSSLVRAALLPTLAAGAIPGSHEWHQLVCTPGSDPFRALARQVARLADRSDHLSLVDDLAARFIARRDGFRTAVEDLVAADPRPVMLVVDQFEELFTLCGDDRSRQCHEVAVDFVAALTAAVTDSAGLVRVVITLRADFLDPALQLPGMKTLLGDPVLLGPLDDTALREVIAGPAKAVGALFEKGLIAAILRDVHDEQGALPLLQHALLELWLRRRGPWLTLDAYDEIGGVGGALAHRADATYASLPPRQQRLAHLILLRLVTFGEGVADTRRRVQRAELYPADVDRQDVDAVIQTLSGEQARLVVADQDAVEISHEALLREWDTLRGWLETDREAQRVHRRLTHAAGEWAGPLGREPGALYRGAQLAQANEWAGEHAKELNAVEAEFLDASRRASADELERERQRSRRLRRRLYATMGFFAVAVVGVVAALVAFGRATAATERAEDNAARALAQQALALAPQQPTLALAVAAEALARRNTPEVADALQQTHASYLQADWRTSAVLTGHTGYGHAHPFSPDGDRIATISDNVVTTWDATTGEEHATLVHPGSREVSTFAWSTNGERLGTVQATTVKIWHPATGRELDEFHMLGGDRAAFSGDASRVAVPDVLHPDLVLVYDVTTGEELLALPGHSDGVSVVSWAPSGDRLATAVPGIVKIWDPDTGEVLTALGPGGTVADVVFAEDGDRVATLAVDTGSPVTPVVIWDTTTGERLKGLGNPTVAVHDMAFDVDGDRAATAAEDGTVSIWNLTAGEEPMILTGHTSPVKSLAFTPDGDRVASLSDDHVIKLWDATTGGELTTLTPGAAGEDDTRISQDRLEAPVPHVAFTADGNRLAASIEGNLRVWEAATASEQPRALTGHIGPVTGVAFGPDGDRLATVSSRAFDINSAVTPCPAACGTVTVWSAATGERIKSMSGRTEPLHDVAFSPDGRRIAAATGTFSGVALGKARIWDVATGEETITLTSGAMVRDVAWSPDGDEIATASVQATFSNGRTAITDGTATIWNAATGEEVVDLTGPLGVWSIEWSPVGSRIATAAERAITIRDAATGDELATMTAALGDVSTARSSAVLDLAFDPDGERIASASERAVTIWDAATGDELATMDAGTDALTSVTFASDGGLIAAGSRGGTVIFWDSASGRELTTLVGHSGAVTDVAWSPDGNRMATAGHDRTVLLRQPVLTSMQACDVIAAAVTAAELEEALAGADPIACTDLR